MVDIDNLKERFSIAIYGISDVRLRALCLEVYNDYPEALEREASPYHHCYVGGLFEHCIEVAEFGETVCNMLDNENKVSRSLVLAAGLLHDIGKVRVPDVRRVYAGSSIGHVDYGITMVGEVMDRLDFDEIEKSQLLNIVNTHHNLFSINVSSGFYTLEAYIVAMCDSLSAMGGCVLPQLPSMKIVDCYSHKNMRSSVFK